MNFGFKCLALKASEGHFQETQSSVGNTDFFFKEHTHISHALGRRAKAVILKKLGIDGETPALEYPGP